MVDDRAIRTGNVQQPAFRDLILQTVGTASWQILGSGALSGISV
jgi:hypothetical protein